MTQKELAAMVAAEEKRLGIGSSDFMECHREIMELANKIQEQNKNAVQVDMKRKMGNLERTVLEQHKKAPLAERQL